MKLVGGFMWSWYRFKESNDTNYDRIILSYRKKYINEEQFLYYYF